MIANFLHTPRALHLLFARAIVRSAISMLLVTGLYAAIQLPDEHGALVLGVGALIMVAAFLTTVARQSHRIVDSPHPGAIAFEALTLIYAMFVLGFALVYVTLSHIDPGAFSEPLDKIDAAYFTLTTLTTVGFGDIAPRSGLARIIVCGQIVAGLVVLGALARGLSGLAFPDGVRPRAAASQRIRRPDTAAGPGGGSREARRPAPGHGTASGTPEPGAPNT